MVFRYRERMQLVSRKIRSAPFKPAEHFVKWIEFANAFDGDLSELDLAGATMGPLQYYSLDVVLPAIALAVILICLLWKAASLAGLRRLPKEKSS